MTPAKFKRKVKKKSSFNPWIIHQQELLLLHIEESL